MLRFLILLLCLAGPARAFEVQGSDGPVSLPDTPERIVALGWGLAELLVKLDIVPVAVADPAGYATWVVRPALPEGTADAGLRNEPNLERLANLKPELILAGDQQTGLLPQLRRIAPTVHYEAFSARHDNAAASRAAYLDLARAFDREALARDRLAALDARIAQAGDRVRAAFGGEVPPVLPIRLLTPTSLRLHGANSMAAAALAQMGLRHADPGAPTDWGFRQLRPEDLAAYSEAAVIHIDPFAQKEALFSTALWRALPCVRAGRFAVAEPAWTFGGVFSLGALADSLSDALLRIAEERT